MTQRKRWRTTEAVQQRARELRREQTPAERRLWARLRRKQLYGLRFRRQHPIGSFIVDFCCVAHKLVVEIDGHSHGAQVEYDETRTAWLEERGYKVVRFTNDQVHRHLDAVLAEIARQCDISTQPNDR
jgi:very-short-patch-repair endonuclease